VPDQCQISFNQGQACSAGSRIFVHKAIYDEFVKKFTEKAQSLKVGDPFAPDSYNGSVVSKAQFEVNLHNMFVFATY
jgi:aldehyde dehydrogenase (NAD+)